MSPREETLMTKGRCFRIHETNMHACIGKICLTSMPLDKTCCHEKKTTEEEEDVDTRTKQVVGIICLTYTSSRKTHGPVLV